MGTRRMGEISRSSDYKCVDYQQDVELGSFEVIDTNDEEYSIKVSYNNSGYLVGSVTGELFEGFEGVIESGQVIDMFTKDTPVEQINGANIVLTRIKEHSISVDEYFALVGVKDVIWNPNELGYGELELDQTYVNLGFLIPEYTETIEHAEGSKAYENNIVKVKQQYNGMDLVPAS